MSKEKTPKKTQPRDQGIFLEDSTQVNSESLQQVYDYQMSIFDRVHQSDYYEFRVHADQSTSPTEASADYANIPYIHGEFVEAFYRKSWSHFNLLFSTQQQLTRIGAQHLIDPNIPTDEMLKVATDILKASYIAVKCCMNINTAASSPSDDLMNGLKGYQRLQYKNMIEQIGTEKPETFRETARRYLPRWCTYPLAFPAELIPTTHHEIAKQLWHQYSQKDARYLISAADQTEGKLPLHLCLHTARALEQSGHEDTAYQLRIWATKQILEMEKDRFQAQYNYESPFFTTIMGGFITGEIIPTAHSGFFNIQQDMHEIMRTTFHRFQAEQDQLQAGPATNFLKFLASCYTKNTAEIMARSVISHAALSSEFDQNTVLTHLANAGIVSKQDLFGFVQKHPQRPIITAAEAGELKDVFDPITTPLDTSTLAKDISQLTEQNEIYSFNTSWQVVGLPGKMHEGGISIDLDLASETVTVSLTRGAPGKARSFEYQFNFSGEVDSFVTDTLLDQSTIPDQVASKYITIAWMAIQRETERIQQKSRKRRIETAQSPEPQPAFQFQRLNRVERMALYEQQKQQSQKRRIRQVSDTQVDTRATPEIAAAPEQVERKIINLDYDSVQDLLQAEEIGAIKPEQFIKKLNHFLHHANISNKMLGKRIDISNFGYQKHRLDLRQLNWDLDGGITAIRVYLEDLGDGEFALRGVLRKKGENMQTRYLENLVKKLLQNRDRDN